MDAGFGGTREHEVGVAEGYEAGGVADGVGARRAGCRCGVVGAFEAVFHGEVAGGQVDEEFGDEDGGDFGMALGFALDECRSIGVEGDTYAASEE